MNADAVAALLHDVLGAECSGTHSLGYATCQRQAAALAAAPLPSEPTEESDPIETFGHPYRAPVVVGGHQYVHTSECAWPAPLPSDTPADGLAVCDCEPEHVWPCATIPRCDEPGCERETSCGFPTPAGYRRTCGDHYRAALALTQEPRPGDDR